MKSFNGKFALALAAGVSLTALSQGANAQEAEAVEEGNRRLQTVTVTAEKQETNLQETPIAITAISEDVLEFQNVVDVRDISGLAPNVSINPGITAPSQAVITMRRIVNPSDESLTLDTPIGLYIDGVYIARSVGSAVEVADVGQIEVLRGPQGTLFGRNTTGGAINFITKRPSEESDITLEGTYGNYNLRKVKLSGNTGTIGGGLRLSGALSYRARDGSQDDLLSDDDQDPGAFESTAGRFAAEFEPTASSNVYYTFDFADSEDYSPAFQTTLVAPQVAGFLANSTTTAGCNLDVTSGRAETLCLNDQAPVENTTYGHTLKIENDFGPMTLRSTTGIRSWENSLDNSDIDGFGVINGPSFSQATLFNGLPAALTQFIFPDPNPATAVNETALFIETLGVPTADISLFSASNEREQDQWSQEFELIGNTDGAFDWVVGAFYFKEESSENNEQLAGFVLDTNGILGGIPGLGAGLAASNLPENQFRALIAPSNVIYDTDAESYAVYGQGSYRFGGPDGKFGLTLGLRHTWDEKSINQTQSIVNSDSYSDSALTGHLTADMRFSDDVNGYAKYSRGYRSGGFNTRTVQDPFESEFINSYEAGLKTELANGLLRLNGAVFFSQYTDEQIVQPITAPVGGGFQNVIVNAGETEYTGIEFEALAKPTDALTLNASFGYTDREVKEFPFEDATTNGVINIADEILPGTAPDTTFNFGAAYEWNLGNGDLTARVNSTYEASRTFFANPRTSPLATQLEAGSRNLVDAQLRWDDISVGGKNTNMYVMLWGKNIFDEEYEVRAIDFGPLGFGGFVYGQPATFGIDVGVTF